MPGSQHRPGARGPASKSSAPVPPSARTTPLGVPGAGFHSDARRALFRARHTAPPLWWLLVMAAAGLAAHQSRWIVAGVVAGPVIGFGVIAAVRGDQDEKSRLIAAIGAAITCVIIPALAVFGPSKPLAGILLVLWAVPSVMWTGHHRPRITEPAIDDAEADHDLERWDRLARRYKWSASLVNRRRLPNGGRQWDIELDGSQNHIGDVMAQNRSIAAAWDKPQTEAYAEPAPDGVESRGILTLLGKENLSAVRNWTGEGADTSGVAVIGRFADGADAHIRLWAPRDGIRHGLVAGTTGAGKSYTLDLLVRIALATGRVVPVVLDPQNGQSLPQWRGRLLYASGEDECLAMLAGLRAGMLARSRFLSSVRWTDEDGDEITGMDFFDAELLRDVMPAVLVIADEFPMLLSEGRALSAAKDIAKLGRKTGVALWAVAQVPSLEELGSQVLRSMLAGGNIIGLRTGDRVSAGMLGLTADPSQLPMYFRDRTPTYGLGYVLGPDQRQAPARVDIVPSLVRKQFPDVPPLDAVTAACIDKAMGVLTGSAGIPAPAGVAAPSEEPDGPQGHTCADAVLRVLENAGRPVRSQDLSDEVKALSARWNEKAYGILLILKTVRGLVKSGAVAESSGRYWLPEG